jgi:hypothetical protein
MRAKPAAPVLRLVDGPPAVRSADPAPPAKDGAPQEGHPLKNRLDVPGLLAEVQSPDIHTEKLINLAMATWKLHGDAARILAASIKALRGRLPANEYRALLAQMPGFII